MEIEPFLALLGVIITGIFGYSRGQAKVKEDLQIEYDKTLRAQRITVYKELMKHMRRLPKYPEPEDLTYDKLKKLGCSFTDWYFCDGGGLFLSERSRYRYFDLQDGIKIVLRKHTNDWKLDLKNDNDWVIALKKELERDKEWNCPPELKAIAVASVDTKDAKVPEQLVTYLRKLGSLLRTQLTEDILSRKIALLQSSWQENPYI